LRVVELDPFFTDLFILYSWPLSTEISLLILLLLVLLGPEPLDPIYYLFMLALPLSLPLLL
jgi:hypothetical protein